ncbi:MAG: EamA family transporter [Pseudomonadales bacterium]
MKTSDLIVAISVCALWGFNFSVIKLGVDHLDPFLLTALRLSFAALPGVFLLPRPEVAMRFVALYGLLFGVGLWGIMSLSIHWGLSAGMASVVLRGSAFFSVLIGVYWFRERLNLAARIGVALSLAGLGLSFYLEDGSVTVIGLLLALLAGLSLSLLSALVKQLQVQQMLAFIVWSCLFAPVPLLLLASWVNGTQVIEVLSSGLSSSAWFSILFQAYPTTVLGYWLWSRLLVKYPMSALAPLSLLVPLFGVCGSMLFYGERIGGLKTVALGLVLAGVLAPFIGAALTRKAIATLSKKNAQ